MNLTGIAALADELADLLEAHRKGLNHPRHARHVAPARAKIKSVLAHFFGRQKHSVLSDVRPRLRRELLLHPRESIALTEIVSQGGKQFARRLLPSALDPLTFAVTSAEASDYASAITTLIEAAAKTLGGTAAVAEDVAGTYLRSHSLSKLTGGLDRTSIDRLQNAMADAWDKGGTFNSIVSSITDTFDTFSTTRAEMIAQTEANDAYNSGRRAVADALGLDEKQWDPDGEACPVCMENADAGWIDIDEEFPSGDQQPTSHPGCDCGCDFRRSAEPDIEQDE